MNVRRVKPLSNIVFLCLALGLSACAFERDPQVLQNPLYKSGHAAGCQSAHTRVSGFDDTIHRDKTLYANESLYRTGWGDGYASCGGQSQYDERSVFNERRDNTDIRY
jgi:hypothetical protein